MRKARTGRGPVRRQSLIIGAVAAIAAAPLSFPAPANAAVAAAASDSGIDEFYARHGQPLWFQGGQPSAAAEQLLTLLGSAELDGLDPAKYRTEALSAAMSRAWGGDPRALRKADEQLTRAFVAYARDLRAAPAAGMIFADPRLKPSAPSALALLKMAASAPSLDAFVRDMGWMNPAYAPLRRALASGSYDQRQRDLLRVNLARARVLPAGRQRYVIVNAAAQRLEMFEGDRLVDSMRVVVGKQKDNNRTPMLASLLNEASLNPYWNVPPDLAAERIAPNVVKQGLGYLRRHGYEVLSDWGDYPARVDPETIDWQAVADGKIQVRVRQVPGPGNGLGKVKFTFPNRYGVYLHDTPDKQLLEEDTRLFSGGCIRLEDADRFGAWLFGRQLEATSDEPDIEVPLGNPVPVYVTYLTAVPDGSSIAFLDDVYGWDEQRLAELRSTGSRIAGR